MSFDPLSAFLNEKTADAAPGPAEGGLRTGITRDPDPQSLDSGERAMAGLAAVGGSVAAKAIPFVSSLALKPFTEAGSVPVHASRTPAARMFGLFDIPGRLRTESTAAQRAATIHKRDEIADIVNSFASHHDLERKGVKIRMHGGPLSRLLGPNYNTATKTVNLPRVGKEIALHELGHAADYAGRKMGRFRAIAEPMLSRGVLTALPIALIAGDRIKEVLPGTIDDKAIEFMQNNAPGIMAATLAATSLYPEAKASALAMRHIAKTEGTAAAMQSLKRLGPAFGTYLMGAIPAVVGMAFARKYMREARGEKAETDALAQEQIRELEKTSGLMRDALSWSKELGRDLGHVGRHIGHQTAAIFKQPGTMRRIGQASKEVGASPEFVMSAMSSAVPATLGALYLYGTPSGKEVRARISPEHTDAVYTGSPKGVLLARNADEAWRERHPLRYAGLVAAGAALSGGVLAKFFTDLLKVT
jgi:hypothetical protein